MQAASWWDLQVSRVLFRQQSSPRLPRAAYRPWPSEPLHGCLENSVFHGVRALPDVLLCVWILFETGFHVHQAGLELAL